LAEKKAKEAKIKTLQIAGGSVVGIAVFSVIGILAINPFFAIKPEYQGTYVRSMSWNDSTMSTFIQEKGTDVALTKEIYKAKVIGTGKFSYQVEIKDNAIVYPSGISYNINKMDSKEISDGVYELTNETFDVVDEGIIFDDTYRVTCKGTLTFGENVVNFDVHSYDTMKNTQTKWGEKDCSKYKIDGYGTLDALYEKAKEDFESTKTALSKKSPVDESHYGKVYVEGKYKATLSADSFPIRVGKKTKAIKDLRLSKVDRGYIISNGTFEGKKCTGSFKEYSKYIYLRYRCGKESGSANLYKKKKR
jgi:hypothetical protein